MALMVTRADLEKASSTVRSGLDNISSNATLVTGQIEAFINDSVGVLTGNGFDYVRNKMALYLSAVEKLSTLCEMLANNIIEANNYMINETQGLDLNTENIEELEQRVKQIENLIGWYSELVVVDDTVPEEERQYVMRNQSMKNYYEEILKTIKERLELLKRLPEIAAGAAGLLDAISNDNSKFATCVDLIVPSSF